MKRKVCVIGAGISGLPTAVHILEQNPDVEVTIIADKFSPDTTGDGATGWWAPFLPGDNKLEDIKRWGKVTWNHYTALLRSGQAPEVGIQLVHGYDVFDTVQEDPYWKDDVFGYRRVSPQEIKELFPANSGLRSGRAYTSYVTECDKYLPWLLKRFKQQGGKVQKRRIESIGELATAFDVVVNCSGVYSYYLVNDRKVVPIRGQAIKVRAPWHKVMFAFFHDNKVTHSTPKSDYVILGATKEEGRWDSNVYAEDRRDILERNCKFVPSLRNAEILSDFADVRPGRSNIRVEKEIMKFGPHRIQVKGKLGVHDINDGQKLDSSVNREIQHGKNIEVFQMVVHNYGHGGSGITFHWGCAQDAAKLVQECLQDISKATSKL